ncbi:MAG: HNH endonuclease [Deltaproteobacteria bacterium]|nr:HNH endonuclease [Deltaproteobacteria bacterium]
MEGYVAVTDHGWYEKLAYEPGSRDVNFWRPSTRAFRLVPGTPFFFKLKAPYNAVVGFGYFVSFTVLPDWLAWETFGEGNGVANLEALRGRLGAIQKGARIAADPAGRIGCCLLAEARFFGVNQWVKAPTDWKPRTQTGAGYDLSKGEGLRVWQECIERARAMAPNLLEAAEPSSDEPRYGEPTLHRPRLGQGIFRIQVLDAYDRACAVTGEHSLPVLEAAHIKPYSRGGIHEVPNGITLRSDVHRLFDRGYVTVDDNRLIVGKRLRDDFANGRSYYSLHGKPIQLPGDPTSWPAAAAIQWHREHVFLG